jgi:hypothetical protein
MKRKDFFFILIILIATLNIIRLQDDLKAQNPDENKLKLSGELLTDERFLLKNQNDWAWNETRLSLNLDKKITGNSKFYSEVWLRNIGLPNIITLSDTILKSEKHTFN